MVKFSTNEVEGSLVVECDRHFDSRGFFQELYNSEKYFPDSRIIWKQVNCSSSKEGVLRGLHLAPYAKLVSCISGRIFDVCLDMRENSPTYLQHTWVELTAENKKQLFVPGGCAHGFLALKDSVITYLQAGTWIPKEEFNLRYDDFGIQWPYKYGSMLDRMFGMKDKYILSDKDANALSKEEYFKLKHSLQIESQANLVGMSQS